MKHSCTYQIMWQDTNACREVSPSRLMTYMQETAGSQLTEAGISLDHLRDVKGLAFLVTRIALRQYRPLYCNDVIQVNTWISEGRGYSFDRFFSVHRDGELIAQAHTVWALLDLKSGTLVKNRDFSYGFSGDIPLLFELSPRMHIPRQAELTPVASRTVRYSDIDYNRHMNNCHYLDMLMDYVPDPMAERAIGFVLSFVGEAAYGQTLSVLRAPAEEGYWFCTKNEEGKTCLEAYVETEPYISAPK